MNRFIAFFSEILEKLKKYFSEEYKYRIMNLASLEISDLKMLQENSIECITLPDGVELEFSMDELEKALTASLLMRQADEITQGIFEDKTKIKMLYITQSSIEKVRKGCELIIDELSEAIEMYEAARILNPVDPILMMSLGHALCKIGEIRITEWPKMDGAVLLERDKGKDNVAQGLLLLKRAVSICNPDYREKERVEENYLSAKNCFQSIIR